MKTTLANGGAQLRSISRLTGSVAAAAALTAAAPALGQESAEDAVRFRGGIQSEIGPAIFFTNGHASLVTGLTGRVGVQLGETFGVFFAPQVQGFLGQESGPYVGGAIMGDVTIADAWAVGLGPEMGFLAPDGERENGGGPISSPTVGGVARFAVHPDAEPGDDGRRSGLTLGLDLRVRANGVGYNACGGCGPDGPPLVLMPTLFIGHEAY